ncbi:MAG: hypothetical protein AAGK04_09040, partial [Planctomycetota bacterium]
MVRAVAHCGRGTNQTRKIAPIFFPIKAVAPTIVAPSSAMPHTPIAQRSPDFPITARIYAFTL